MARQHSARSTTQPITVVFLQRHLEFKGQFPHDSPPPQPQETKKKNSKDLIPQGKTMECVKNAR